MFVYQYIPLCVKLAVPSRDRDSVSADASGSGRHGDGCKLHPSGMQRYIRTMLRVALCIRARGLAQPVDRCTPALVVCLYPAMFGIANKMGLVT